MILLIIPVVALLIDRFFFFVQAELFPYRYGGMGILHRFVRGVLHAWEDMRLAVWNVTQAGSGGNRPDPRPPPNATHAMSTVDPKATAAPTDGAGQSGRHGPGARRAFVSRVQVREPHVVEFRDVTKTYQCRAVPTSSRRSAT